MATPVYMICSEGGSLDKATNTVSIYGVIEKVVFAPVNKDTQIETIPGGGNVFLNIRVTAAWRRNENEVGTAFDHQTRAFVPGIEEPKVMHEGSFVFKHTLHRFIVGMAYAGINDEGTIRIENRIREVGQDEWLCQSYEIPVEKMELSQKPASDD